MNILDVVKLCFNKEQVKMMKPVATNYYTEGKKLEWHPDWLLTLNSQDAVYFFIERATGRVLKIGETAATVRKLINRMYDYNGASCPLGKFMTMPGSPSVQVIALPLDRPTEKFGKLTINQGKRAKNLENAILNRVREVYGFVPKFNIQGAG
jgi:hypothetical protein